MTEWQIISYYLEASIVWNAPFVDGFLEVILTVLKFQNAPFRAGSSVLITYKLIRKYLNLLFIQFG
ncbi:MAG: hypothetical protein BA862_10500 [Desulfobulbaceae bacterium S3730MH12]|nr:MAG: hypothetical protein BA862_10500 [Desulfobulbaceae bacterium S3730MH12]